MLRGSWPHIGRVALVEFKSPSHEFCAGDLVKLCSYGLEYLHIHRGEFDDARELALVLVTPRKTRRHALPRGDAARGRTATRGHSANPPLEELLAGLEPEALVRALRSLPRDVQDAVRNELDGS